MSWSTWKRSHSGLRWHGSAQIRPSRVVAVLMSDGQDDPSPLRRRAVEAGRRPIVTRSVRGEAPTTFDGFLLEHIDTGEVTLRVRHGGAGAPVVLLHGHPRTQATWHAVAPRLAAHHFVVAPDLRGYGQSTLPPDVPGHVRSSKRAMAGVRTPSSRAPGGTGGFSVRPTSRPSE
jgi:hypothetical protein